MIGRQSPLSGGGQVRLEQRKRFDAKRLNPTSLDGIIEAVDQWYEALFSLVMR
jgi:hypothetical protein